MQITIKYAQQKDLKNLKNEMLKKRQVMTNRMDNTLTDSCRWKVKVYADLCYAVVILENKYICML